MPGSSSARPQPAQDPSTACASRSSKRVLASTAWRTSSRCSAFTCRLCAPFFWGGPGLTPRQWSFYPPEGFRSGRLPFAPGPPAARRRAVDVRHPGGQKGFGAAHANERLTAGDSRLPFPALVGDRFPFSALPAESRPSWRALVEEDAASPAHEHAAILPTPTRNRGREADDWAMVTRRSG